MVLKPGTVVACQLADFQLLDRGCRHSNPL